MSIGPAQRPGRLAASLLRDGYQVARGASISEERLVSDDDSLRQWEEDRERDRARRRLEGDRYGNQVGSRAWNQKRRGMSFVALGVGSLGVVATAPKPLAYWWLAAIGLLLMALGCRTWRAARREYGGPWFE